MKTTIDREVLEQELSPEEKALGAFLSAMYECKLDGAKMREAMLKVLGLNSAALAAQQEPQTNQAFYGLEGKTCHFGNDLEELKSSHPNVKDWVPYTPSFSSPPPAPVVPQGWLEFVTDVSKQTPEKPDYWSSCGQCDRNIQRAEDLLSAAPTPGEASHD